MKDCFISLNGVAFEYPKSNFSLRAENVHFDRGEITLILGANGSGKTTLAKLMCGILKQTNGEILHGGENIKDFSLGKIGQKVSYLFQEPKKQLFTSNVWSEMTFVGQMLEQNMSDVTEKAQKLLEKFNLIKLRNRSIYRLSRGETQRLAIASLLMGDVEFLILDEPTSGLDKDNREILFNTLESLSQNAIGIAIVTHDKEVVERFGKNIVRLDKGNAKNVNIAENDTQAENCVEQNVENDTQAEICVVQNGSRGGVK